LAWINVTKHKDAAQGHIAEKELDAPEDTQFHSHGRSLVSVPNNPTEPAYTSPLYAVLLRFNRTSPHVFTIRRATVAALLGVDSP
jgi:coproporphyrinogen III oxidase